MKIGYLLLLMLMLVTCTKGMALNKKKYLSYDDFKKKYSYFYYNNYDSFYCNLSIPTNKSLYNMENDILVTYLRKKEDRLEYLEHFKSMYLNQLDYKEQTIQLGELIVDVKRQNKIMNDIETLSFLGELINNINKDIGEIKFYEILEASFTKEKIFTIIELITYNPEFEYYGVEDRLGLPKVDEINLELGKKEALSEEEWSELERRGYVKKFKDEESNIRGGAIYLLSSNKIIIVNEENQILKEVKVKNYKEIEYLVYKDILYIYSDKKIYEVPLDNLDKVNIIDIEKI